MQSFSSSDHNEKMSRKLQTSALFKTTSVVQAAGRQAATSSNLPPKVQTSLQTTVLFKLVWTMALARLMILTTALLV